MANLCRAVLMPTTGDVVEEEEADADFAAGATEVVAIVVAKADTVADTKAVKVTTWRDTNKKNGPGMKDTTLRVIVPVVVAVIAAIVVVVVDMAHLLVVDEEDIRVENKELSKKSNKAKEVTLVAVPEVGVEAAIVVGVAEDEAAIAAEIPKLKAKVEMVASIWWKEVLAVTRKLVEAIVDRVEAGPFLVVDDDLEVPLNMVKKAPMASRVTTEPPVMLPVEFRVNRHGNLKRTNNKDNAAHWGNMKKSSSDGFNKTIFGYV